MQTYGTAAPRIGKVAPGTKPTKGLIGKAMATPKPQAPKAPAKRSGY